MQDPDVFQALANPIRRQILFGLREGPRSVTELAAGFEVGRPAISEHLQVLRKARLIREEPRGQHRFYHLDPRPLADVESWVASFGKYWKQRLTALEELLDKETP